eukprot:gene1495-12112_t
MEKYRRWTDDATGINPFVPHVASSSIFKKYLMVPILFILKLPFLLLLILAFLLTRIFTFIFVGRLFERIFNFFVLRTILFLFGFLFISNKNDSKKSMKSGDVIIANHISYIEVIYLNLIYAPVFTRVNLHNDKLIFTKCSFFECLKFICFGDLNSKNTTSDSLSKLMKTAKDGNLGPIILFPESTTTNGKSILKFQNIFDENFENVLKKEKLDIHVIGFKFQFSNFSPCFHLNNFYSHLFLLMGQFYNKLEVVTIDLGQNSQTFDASFIRGKLSLATKSKLISSSLKDKISFMEYWNETHSKDYIEK